MGLGPLGGPMKWENAGLGVCLKGECDLVQTCTRSAAAIWFILGLR